MSTPVATPAPAVAPTTTQAANTSSDPAAPVAPTAAPAEAAKVEKTERASQIAAEKLRVLRAQSQLKTEQQKLAQEAKVLEDWKATVASKDPIKILKAAGQTPEQITQFLLNGGAQPDSKVQELETQLNETKAKVQSFEQQKEEEKKAFAQAQVEEARHEAFAAIAEAKETLPWVNALGQNEAVLKEMNDHYAKTGEMLDLEQAAVAVEKRLADSMPAYLEKLLAFPQVKGALMQVLEKLAAASATATEQTDGAEPKAQVAETQGGIEKIKPPTSYRYRRPTLSNDLAQTTTTTGPTRNKRPNEVWAELKKKIG